MGRKDDLREKALGDGTIVSIDHDTFSDEILQNANALAKSLGVPTIITYEASGHHQYVPCPLCIEEQGKAAVDEPKLSINWDKQLALTKDYEYLGFDYQPWQAADALEARLERDKTICCMKVLGGNSAVGDNVRHFTTVAKLHGLGNLRKRYPDLVTEYREAANIRDKVKEDNWVLHEATGIMVPPPPGTVIPLSQLHQQYGDSHPVFLFLRQRGFADWAERESHLHLGYCVEEFPTGQNNVWYKDIGVDGWKDTPQNRLILYTMKDGAPVSWQARRMDIVSDDGLHRYSLHPYRNEWVHTHSRPSRDTAWIGVGPYTAKKPNGKDLWDPSKYKTATHSYRHTAPMGWDAAMAYNLGQNVRWCMVGEGPLDILRTGAPGLSALGKSLPKGMPRMIAENFEVVFLMFDNDIYGRRATEKVKSELMKQGGIIRDVIPIQIGFGREDVGDMNQNEWLQTIEPLKNRYLI